MRAVERAAIARGPAARPQSGAAARRLGISRASIYTKMKTYGLAATAKRPSRSGIVSRAPVGVDLAVSSRHADHTVDFFEIPVLDMAGAKAFYGAAFGWSFKD